MAAFEHFLVVRLYKLGNFSDQSSVIWKIIIFTLDEHYTKATSNRSDARCPEHDLSKEKVADVQLFTKQTDTKIDGKSRF